MAEPIVTDPISSDGSEDSWILLDETDEEMNEVNGIVNEFSVEAAPAATVVPKISIEHAKVATETYHSPQIEEIYDNDFDNGIDFASKMETITSDLIDTYPSDDSSDAEQMYSSRPYDRVSLSPTNDDGSTTDSSISMINDTEFHRYNAKPKRKLSKYTKNQLNTLMGKPCIVDEVINFLERLDNFFATPPLAHVILLIVAIASLTSLCIMCNRCADIKFAFADLNQKYFELQVQSMETDGQLARCEFFYEQELKNMINKSIATESSATEKNQKTDATNLETESFETAEYAMVDIHPTKSSGKFESEATIDKTEIPYMVPTVVSLYKELLSVGHDEPESLSNYKSYGHVDDEIDFLDSAFLAKCSKSEKVNCDIDAEAAIECERTERGYICENDAMSDFATKYIQDEHIHHTATIKPHRSMDDESKSRNEEKKIDKTKTTVKQQVIEREKIQRKENERDKKKYYDKKDCKRSKGKKDKENRDSGKWNKAESKRTVPNTYEHRYDD